MALLNELSPQAGSLNVQGTVAYASQEPWILSGNAGIDIYHPPPSLHAAGSSKSLGVEPRVSSFYLPKILSIE